MSVIESSEPHILRSIKRGFNEDDTRWFSPEELLKLQRAQEEVKWLLDREYKIDSIIEMIGNHYQFSIRQRNALQRSTGSESSRKMRRDKLLSSSNLREGCIFIDGFNLIITLEVALSGGVIISCNDGTIRDIAGLRGTYSVIDKTEMAIELMGKVFQEFEVPKVKFYLDSAVSNSGRLKAQVLKQAEQWNTEIEVELVPNADPILSRLERVVTSDSIILDACLSWFNLARIIIDKFINEPKLIDLSGNSL